jgi:hypothetical protein
MKKRSKYILTGVVIVVLLIAVLHFADAKTFKGRVIDADTKEPIEGAVVVAYWYKAIATIAGESTTLKDVKECLTDKNGKWSITGPKGRPPGHGPIPPLSLFISYTREPVFIVFKPGYCSVPKGFSIDACRNRIRIIGGKDEGVGEGGTLELPKLTNREDRWRNESVGPIYAASDDPREEKGFLKKQIEFLRLLNEERRSLSLDQYNIEELKK